MKTVKSLPIFLALLLVAGAAQAEKLKERFDRTVPLKAGAKITLENANGPVVFEAWDRDEVRIEAEKWAESKRSDVARKALGQVRILVNQTPGALKIRTQVDTDSQGEVMDWLLGKEVRTGVSYRVRVPRQAIVAASNVNGALSVNALQGGLDLTTVNGRIAISGANGSVRATTVNGGIEAELADVSDDLRFETVNGGVELRLPADSRLTLDASMAHGVVRSDFPVAGANPKKKNILKGNVNGGGSRVTIRTVNGGIQVSRL
ncbi:MAG TPA: DUF4097 family beta strand repeat-containing protein [Thermoanaerobaculia bacterium]|nr:DUF4097 family beta strand repeat-containing protein [Thermoanaerobaculia bacterium]